MVFKFVLSVLLSFTLLHPIKVAPIIAITLNIAAIRLKHLFISTPFRYFLYCYDLYYDL